jgi:hypothetical protein
MLLVLALPVAACLRDGLPAFFLLACERLALPAFFFLKRCLPRSKHPAVFVGSAELLGFDLQLLLVELFALGLEQSLSTLDFGVGVAEMQGLRLERIFTFGKLFELRANLLAVERSLLLGFERGLTMQTLLVVQGRQLLIQLLFSAIEFVQLRLQMRDEASGFGQCRRLIRVMRRGQRDWRSHGGTPFPCLSTPRFSGNVSSNCCCHFFAKDTGPASTDSSPSRVSSRHRF